MPRTARVRNFCLVLLTLVNNRGLGSQMPNARSKETAMRFWIQCTTFETGKPIHINIALVGSMSRDGERTVLAFVGGGEQEIEVSETPE